MTNATTSAVGRRTGGLIRVAWGRIFASLSFAAAHVDNTFALAWYASHLASAGRVHRRAAPIEFAGADATRSRTEASPMRRTTPREGDRS